MISRFQLFITSICLSVCLYVNGQQCNNLLLGGSNPDYAYAIALDSEGNSVIAGMTSDTTWFSNSEEFETNYDLPGALPETMFMAKLNPNGELIWFIPIRLIGYGVNIEGMVRPFYLTMDGDDNILLAGNYTGDATIGSVDLPYVEPEFVSYFLASFSNDGDFIWVDYSETETSWISTITSIEFDAFGDIWAMLWNEFDIQVDGNTIQGDAVLHYDNQGSLIDYNEEEGLWLRLGPSENYFISSGASIYEYSVDHDFIENYSLEHAIKDFRIDEIGNFVVSQKVYLDQFNIHTFLSRFDDDMSLLWDHDCGEQPFMTFSTNENGWTEFFHYDDQGTTLNVLDENGVHVYENMFGQVLPSWPFSTIALQTVFMGNDIYSVGWTINTGNAVFVCDTIATIDNSDAFWSRVSILDLDTVTNISDLSPVEKYRVYPNPTNGYLSLGLSNTFNASELTFRIVDSMGVVVQMESEVMEHSIKWNLEGLSSGIYYLSIYNKRTQSLEALKIIKL